MNNVLLDTHGKVRADNRERARLRVIQDAWSEAVTKPCRVAKWVSRDKIDHSLCDIRTLLDWQYDE